LVPSRKPRSGLRRIRKVGPRENDRNPEDSNLEGGTGPAGKKEKKGKLIAGPTKTEKNLEEMRTWAFYPRKKRELQRTENGSCRNETRYE